MGKIFISYARADDEPFVKQLYQDLTERGFDIWWDRKAMDSRGLTFLQEIRDAIEGSDRLIAVIGPNAVKSDYVKVEWEHALLFSKGVVPILLKGLEPPGKNDYDIVPQGLSKFHCPDFREKRPYQDALAELVRILTEPVPPLGPFLTAVPSLPAHFLPRRDELVLLGNAVLADIKRPEVVNSARQKTVIVGMGGIGKSVLAAAFARSTETRRTFTDGVAWVSTGQNHDMLSNLKQLGLAFNDKIENYVDIKTARDKLPGLLADKMCLIVLDDIWNVDHTQPFINSLGPRCRLLITTRDGGIASAIEANEHRLGVLTDAAALCFLANWCGKEIDSLPLEAVSVAKECGNLPFALALCGAMARDGTSWPDMLDALKEADLAFIEKKFPNYPYTNLLKSLKISIDALAIEYPDAVKHYQELVVFHNHRSIPEAAIMTLWMHTDGLKERSARKLLVTLNSKALLQLEGEAPNRSVTLHDLQHDYLRATAGDRKNLHEKLLAAYQQKCKEGWAGGPNDGYYFENLAYHLVEAGRDEELRKMLFDFGWVQAKLIATDANSLIRDYDFLPENPDLHAVQRSIRLSAHVLARDKTQLRSQLYGRLTGKESSVIKILLDQIGQWKDGYWLRSLTTSLMTPDVPLLRTLVGHTGPVNAVAVTPDSRRAISASCDNTLKVWDLESGVELRTLTGHEGKINAVAVTPNGQDIVSASNDGTVKVWDIESGALLRTLKGHRDSVHGVIVMPDGTFVVSASWDKTLKVWNLLSGEEMRTLIGHKGVISAVAVTPNGRRIVSSSLGGELKVWEFVSGKELRTLTDNWRDAIHALIVTPDGRRIIFASDYAVKVWDIDSGKELRTFRGHSQNVNAVAVTPDGRYAISASGSSSSPIGPPDYTLKVWDLENGEELGTLTGHSSVINTVAITQDGRYAISGAGNYFEFDLSDNTLKVWNLKIKVKRHAIIGHTGNVNAVVITPDGKYAITAAGSTIRPGLRSSDNTLKVWDLERGAELHTLTGHRISVNAVKLLPDGRRVVSASDDGTLKVWDIKSGVELFTMQGSFSGKITLMEISPDGQYVISAVGDEEPDLDGFWDVDSTLRVWNVENGAELGRFAGHHGEVTKLIITPDSRLAMSASLDGTLKVWDIASGKELQDLKGYGKDSHWVMMTPDGRRAISVLNDNTLRVWSLESGEVLYALKGHTGRVREIAVTQDGKRAISASDDKTLKVWDLENGKAQYTLEGHIAAVISVTVTQDGIRAISASSDNTLKVWDLESGKLLYTLEVHNDKVKKVTLTRDEKCYIFVTGNRTLNVLNLMSGAVIASFSGEGAFTACAVSPDGKTIVAGEQLGRVHILRLEGAD